MKRTYVKLLTVAGLTGCFLFTSCRSAQETTARYEISKVEGNMITIDSTWDANPDKKATTVLKPYKDKVDRKSTRLNSSHKHRSRMPSSA